LTGSTGEKTLSLFCGTSLAARVERVEVQLIAAGSEARDGAFVRPVAGGVACFVEDGSPLNKVAGLGFDGVPSAADLDDVEREFAARSCAVQVELANLAEPEIGAELTGRGYRLVGFENVLGRALTDEQEAATPTGVSVRRTDEDFDTWLDVVAGGFASPDTQGVRSHEQFPREIVKRAMRDLSTAAGVRRYLATYDGVTAGGASCRFADGVAQLTGAATTPAYRRKGVQTALMSARLADARAAHCDIAVITVQPGSKSQQNAQRQGFDLLYTRAILVKQP
jgi:ribosomal protein S18 acetylase RimI-like enzyme